LLCTATHRARTFVYTGPAMAPVRSARTAWSCPAGRTRPEYEARDSRFTQVGPGLGLRARSPGRRPRTYWTYGLGRHGRAGTLPDGV